MTQLPETYLEKDPSKDWQVHVVDNLTPLDVNGSNEPFFIDSLISQKRLLNMVMDNVEIPNTTWPDYEFSVSSSYMVGVGVLEATPAKRLATSLRSLRKIAPESIEESTQQPAEIKLQKSLQFLKHSINIRPPIGKLSRKQLINPRIMTTHLMNYIRPQNDPNVQILDQVEKQFSEELESQDFERLCIDLIFATKPETISTIYNQYIKAVKSMDSSLLRFEQSS